MFLPSLLRAQEFTYTTNNGNITITKYIGPGGDVTIPDKIDGLPVTSIGYFAFGIVYNVTNVTIPNSIVSIEADAFVVCKNLSSVVIPNSVTNIGFAAFSGCSSLTNFVFPNRLSKTGVAMLQYCTSLSNITIPNNIVSIEGQTFLFCVNLTNVIIPASVTNLDSTAFGGCHSLKAIYFEGNAPPQGNPFPDTEPTIYYLPGTQNWDVTFDGRPTAQWYLPYPKILNLAPSFGVQTNVFGFIISWATNSSVVVENCTNLINPSWLPVSTNLLADGASYFSDPGWANSSAQYYRVRVP